MVRFVYCTSLNGSMLRSYGPVAQAMLGSLFTWGVTALGAAGVFFFKPDNRYVLDGSLGFSAGVMTAASFWSLLEPAIKISVTFHSEMGFLIVLIGFLCGCWFLSICDRYFGVGDPVCKLLIDCEKKTAASNVVHTVHLNATQSVDVDNFGVRRRAMRDVELFTKEEMSPAARRSWHRIFLLVMAITLHNIPEGLAVGVGFGAVGSGNFDYSFEKARSLAIGIGLQNFPEGLAVSLPLAAFGYNKWTSFFFGQLSGMVEPIAALCGAIGITLMENLLPFALSFAAGAMIYVVFDDVIPEAQSHGHTDFVIWSLIFGFSLMMTLDVLCSMRFSVLLHCTYLKNLPKSYIEQVKKTIPKKVFRNRFGTPEIVEYERKPEDYEYTEYRPWEQEAEMHQQKLDYQRKMNKKVRPIAPISTIPDHQWIMFRGDRVEVLVGRDKGKQGLINYIVRERNWCFVEGLNCKFQMVGSIKQMGYKGNMVKKECPLDVENEVALVDPVDFKPTKVEWRWNEKGEKIRVSVRSGHQIPIPIRSEETLEYVTPESYSENEKDTTAKVVLQRTFEPQLKLFEEEIMEMYDIQGEVFHQKDTYCSNPNGQLRIATKIQCCKAETTAIDVDQA
ncbi:Zinc transporter ZIP11 [Trichinella patagoniensis]|uniref:Zinc transporter ZIP11 n=1 Tax=Trichinella patagoniensis TaxID=990121 RepID=A0A0V0ZK81_9BILA|nr:Zinc transporter ZIP11 [Trichinella patagoniensis]